MGPKERHKWFDLEGKERSFFRADSAERKRRFPSWAGAEKIPADSNFREIKWFLVRLVQDRCQIAMTSLDFVL